MVKDPYYLLNYLSQIQHELDSTQALIDEARNQPFAGQDYQLELDRRQFELDEKRAVVEKLRADAFPQN